MQLEISSALQVDGPFGPAEIPHSEWQDLWQRSSRASVFQSPAWVHAWWTHFGGSTPWMLTFRHDGDLVGFAPLFLWPEERQVLLIGTGITDSLDILALPEWEREVSEGTFRWLDGQRAAWDLCDLQQLRSDTALVNTSTPFGWSASLVIQDVTPVLTLPNCCDAIPRTDELVYLERRLKKEGQVEFVAATEENFSELFACLLEMHQARWAERQQSGVLSESSVQEFHADAARALLRLGALRLYALRVNGNTVASYYGFHHAGRAVYYLGGFAPEWKRFSVGTLMVGHAISEAVREGAREFDFGRGREPYKYRWGAEDRPTYRRELHA